MGSVCSPWLGSSSNRFTILSRVIDNESCYNLDNRDILRKVIVKIGLERINTQKGVIVVTFSNSRVIRLVISLEFAKK